MNHHMKKLQALARAISRARLDLYRNPSNETLEDLRKAEAAFARAEDEND